MPDFLTEMASKSRARALSARSGMPERELRARILDLPDPLPLQTGPEGFDLITEVKRRSPSIGPLDGAGVVERARAYTEAGAAAISVLTEPDAFGGSLEDLQAISRAASKLPDAIPAMRKDFLTDPYQLLEARAAGAGGALLILRIVSDEELEQMLAVAGETGLFLLLEAFDADDIERAGVAAARATSEGTDALVGVNCRNLETLQVEFDRLEQLSGHLPAGSRRVAESGLETAEDAARLAAGGYDLALVGTALMRLEDPRPAISRMLAAGRAARQLAGVGRYDRTAGGDLSPTAGAR
ncbi:MAG: indole-3-glycerol phosphate synthase TrpC [marine benthic group bacterium]|nr:indole-3-glycerol phosphate synthase TrpC [Gemmatimonadota bacterium]